MFIFNNSYFPASERYPTKVVSRSKIPGIIQGLGNSPTARTLETSIVFAGLAGATLFLLIYFQIMAPPPRWMMAAIVGGGLALGVILGFGLQLPFKGKQKLEFEYSALARMFKSKNYNEIIELENKHKIFLGALPNRFRNNAEHLVNEEGVKGILSLNEDWEVKQANGLMLPYTDSDYTELGVKSERMTVKDHTLLSDEQLNEAAEKIKEMLEIGNVYVHCRAGVGRSAMAVAAYLIMYNNSTVEDACTLIETKRPNSTIRKKERRLNEYANSKKG
ncbi:MAG: dual specificity protein phosphatase family protein [Chlamydiales bacterium]|nr:dual specificity protein phosphatase family protein [Chlamydiales bacterium]